MRWTPPEITIHALSCMMEHVHVGAPAQDVVDGRGTRARACPNKEMLTRCVGSSERPKCRRAATGTAPQRCCAGLTTTWLDLNAMRSEGMPPRSRKRNAAARDLRCHPNHAGVLASASAPTPSAQPRQPLGRPQNPLQCARDKLTDHLEGGGGLITWHHVARIINPQESETVGRLHRAESLARNRNSRLATR